MTVTSYLPHERIVRGKFVSGKLLAVHFQSISNIVEKLVLKIMHLLTIINKTVCVSILEFTEAG